jgi:hypothetical protein
MKLHVWHLQKNKITTIRGPKEKRQFCRNRLYIEAVSKESYSGPIVYEKGCATFVYRFVNFS